MSYPCLCLKRGFFLLITNKTPFLLTILQLALRFLIDALTLILLSFTIYGYLYRNIMRPLVKS